MATFKSKRVFTANINVIPEIAKEIQSQFIADDYEVVLQQLVSGGYDISVTKGNMFKAVLGMKSALKISIEPLVNNQIVVEAGVGIFGQQAIPTVISMLFLWPVLITQIWGMINQANLDDKVIAIAENVIARNGATYQSAAPAQGGKFCTECGNPNAANAKFCSNCGGSLL